MHRIIAPVQKPEKLLEILRTVKVGKQKNIEKLDVCYALRERYITSYLVWDENRQQTVVTYRLLDKGRDFIREHTAETVH